MITLVGKVIKQDKNEVIVSCANPNCDYKEVSVVFTAGMTREQQNKIYALFRDISENTGSEVDEVKEFLMAQKDFSFSTATKEEASKFIDFIIDFCLKNDFALTIDPRKYTTDITAYLYSCLVNKRCAICGRYADLHHWEAIGRGYDRKEIHHLGRKVCALCREHHEEFHNIGVLDFGEKYHIYGVEADERICQTYHLKK